VPQRKRKQVFGLGRLAKLEIKEHKRLHYRGKALMYGCFKDPVGAGKKRK